MTDVSVIVSFYNKFDYLKLVLAGFEIQSNKKFELIIADDGSEEKVVKEIESFASDYPFRIKHIWQEDNGFRKNKILNQAILVSESEYLIFIDGDCVPHSHFVEGHIEYKSSGIALTGRRVNLSQRITNILTPQKIKDRFLEKNFHLLIEDGLFGNSFDVEKGLYFRNKFLRDWFNKKPRGLLGCNFSLHKKDILAINGFDERYEAPSIGEDSDVQFRLELNGVKIKSLNHIAVQYHLYHKLQERPQKNLTLFENVKKDKTFFTSFGIQKP
ncbi:Glycosyltransferase [Ignavibacterium album JCM 16511]|uniref:Glycosyltransferase n=1 Tax=Ignavibacterium album (strain DSM 19864 / JCM 16511 / NBRC 101810 / Mat9-16) TaxID=945713 RepID=I0AN66_IGNAJ|nr:glycosyltransferase [Ignavibacterium album]AFH50423.1 Glycosyltransferase [Ignavibacterium album JCM 16511]